MYQYKTKLKWLQNQKQNKKKYQDKESGNLEKLKKGFV